MSVSVAVSVSSPTPDTRRISRAERENMPNCMSGGKKGKERGRMD